MVQIYTHTSDQDSVFGTRILACGPREAPYALDGLEENNTILAPRVHSTDTHGYTEQLFALCLLLGYEFMPRIKDVADQRLYKMNREARYGRLEPVFDGVLDMGIIPEQWDTILRVAASVRERVTPAHVILQRLAESPADRLARAFDAIGRVPKTIYILSYGHDPEVRRVVGRQLNRGEQRNQLAGGTLFFGNQGEFRSGDYLELIHKASCLSLLSNAVVVWNALQIGRIVEELRAQGETVRDEDLAHVSPLLHEHIIATGTYNFESATCSGSTTEEP